MITYLELLKALRALVDHNGGPIETPYGQFVFVERADFNAAAALVAASADVARSPMADALRRKAEDEAAAQKERIAYGIDKARSEAQ